MNKFVIAVFYFLQIAVISAISILEYLTKKKAGVSHHVIARGHQWSKTFLSEENLNIYLLLAALLLFILCVICIFCIIKKSPNMLPHIIFWIILVALLILSLAGLIFTGFKSYSYILISLTIMNILQLGLTSLLFFNHSNKI